MCTLAIYFQASEEFPLVIAANRDEFLDRPALPPQVLALDPWVVGGKDARAAGTWLGLNAHHLVAGLLNRRTSAALDLQRRSRGMLCLDALRTAATETAAQTVTQLSGSDYNPFNLLLASPTSACVISNFTGHMRRLPLSPGLHLLSNLEVDDPECPRIAKSVRTFEAAIPLLTTARMGDLFVELRRILSDHSTPLDPRLEGIPNNLCVHREGYGTRSSSILVFHAASRRTRMWFADGPPCRSEFVEVECPAPSS